MMLLITSILVVLAALSWAIGFVIEIAYAMGYEDGLRAKTGCDRVLP